jgi:biopolymer transport protein ExbD
MRFARQSTIFRGPIDPAAIVCVLFLLVIFMLMGSLLYTPGALIKLDAATPSDARTITITGENEIIFDGKTNTAADLEPLREELKGAPRDALRLKLDSGADPKVVAAVQALFQIRLPTNGMVHLAGTDNPTVIVEVNFLGQCFFESRPITDRDLKAALRSRLEEAARASQKLTLVLEADQATENGAIMHVCRLGQDAGINNFILAEAAPPERAQP